MSESEITEGQDVVESEAEAAAGGDDGLESLMQEEADALLDGAEATADVGSDSGEPAASADDASTAAMMAEDVPDELAEPAECDRFDGSDTAEAAASASLAARAAEAAHALIEERELEERRQRRADALNAKDDAAAEREAEAARRRKVLQDRLLLGLLVSNLILMGVMMFLPGSKEDPGHTPPAVPGGQVPDATSHGTKDPGHAVAEGPGTRQPDPFHKPLQEPGELLPNAELYDAAQKQVAIGAYDKARELFERYLAAHPELQAFQLQMVYSALAHCLERLGRRLDAQGYLAKIDNLRQITALPDDLWEAARRAEKDKRGADMRRYYARFLLQQDQLGKRWANQGRIAEAYMKIGDSYRLDAEAGIQRAESRSKINRSLKQPTGEKKPEKKEPESKAKGGH